ncbi:MAG TPA: hypothetical protein VJ044_12550 [Candidatus Hodarchaeales archaeon]|nr:hypothetical protein [Candidatus Hodarchaeales archaeon]
MYKTAAKQKLRIATVKGALSVEQLWDLSLTEIDALAVSLEKEHQESGKKSFLTSRSEKDKTVKLKFDIVLDILNTKVDEAEVLQQKKARKERNQKILSLIEEKKDETLKSKSVKQLESLLEED